MTTYRSISKDLLIPRFGTFRRRHYLASGAIVSDTTTYPSWFQSEVVYRGGERSYLGNNPDWKVQISKGSDATTSYSRARASVCMRPYEINQIHKFDDDRRLYTSRGTHIYDPWNFIDRTDIQSLSDIALGRLKNKIGKRDTQVQLMPAVVEARDLNRTVNFVANSASGMLKALLDIKRTKGASAAKYASDVWLNWSFAIKPTYLESIEIAQHIDELLSNPGGIRFTERGTAKREWNTSDVINIIVGGNSNLIVRAEHKLSYRFVSGFKTRLRSSNDYSVGASLGLEFGAMVPALWELTPYSWAVDYFTTMGDYLEDTFLTDQVIPVYCTRTKKYSCDLTYEYGGPVPGNPYFYTEWITGSPCTAKFSSIDRLSYSTIPSRQLRFRQVDEIAHNAVNKVLNLAAVLVGSKGHKPHL